MIFQESLRPYQWLCVMLLQFPLLRAGGKEFVYESGSQQQSSRGSIEGSFAFIPGR